MYTFIKEKKLKNFLIGLIFLKKEFYSLFRYSREMSEDIQILLNKTDTRVLDKYQIEIIENKIFINVKVMNILFRRTSNGL
jgi:hypothetical protein